jgi:hypothetical protein
MHDAIHASSVYVKSRTAYFPDLSLALAANFVNAADLTSAAEFPIVHCVIPTLFHQALDNPRPSLNSCQHTAALAVVCCRTHTLPFSLLSRELPPHSYYPAMLFVSLHLDGF